MKARTLSFVHALESRLLLAAPPPTLLTLSADAHITFGTGDFPTGGEYVIDFASASNSYNIIGKGGLPSTSGTFTYQVISANTARFMADDVGYGAFQVDFTFTTATAGTTVARADGNVVQRTSFTLSGDNFASLSSGVITVGGTIDGDRTTAAVANSQIVLTRNNITQKFSTSGVTKLNISEGDGNDAFNATGLAVPIYLDAGAGNDSIVGGEMNDTITSGSGKNTLDGGNGDDRLNGSGGRDSLRGGAGGDRIYGLAGNDTLDGGGGVDRLFGGDGDDSLIGGGSNDKLYGEAGNDTLYGNAGDDLLDGGTGSNSLFQ